MATPIEDLAVYVQTGGHGTIGTDLFRDHLPESPDACIAILSAPGGPSEWAFGSEALKWERPNVSIWIRKARFEKDLCRTFANTVYRYVGRIQAETINGTVYHFAHMLGAPFWLKDDQNERPIFIMNVELEKEVASS